MRFRFKQFPTRHSFVLEAMGQTPGKLLDVGNLGDGESNCRILKQDVESRGGEYWGLDSNEALTKRMNLEHQIVGDLHKTEFPDNTFDTLYAGEIIEHTWTPGVMISEIHRILKHGGILILDTPNSFNLVHVVRFYLRREDSMGDVRVQTYHEAKNAMRSLKDRGDVLLQPQHKLFYTPAMLLQLLETHGFNVQWMGMTQKPGSWIHRLLLWLFPQGGRHLCVVAKKSTVDDAFSDVKDNTEVFA